MCIIHESYLQHDASDASAASQDALDLEVGHDLGCEGRRWITVGPTDQPGTSAVPEPPAAEDRILTYLKTVHEFGASIAG